MKNSILLFIVTITFGFASCSEVENGRLTVRLTDSPGDYEEVNIDLQSVQINANSNENGENGWAEVSTNSGIYNLLDLTNGTETLIADESMASGKIGQIRLVLGSENTVVVDGISHNLTTPSAQQSGLKVQVHKTLLEGVTYSILLDFDAAKSIVKTGAGGYILKPVITAVTEATSGAIEGTVNPSELNIAIYAMQGMDTVKTSYATENTASFLVGGLEAGTYNLVFDPGENSGFTSSTIEDVVVTTGEVADTGETTLSEN